MITRNKTTIKENNKYRLVFETNEITGINGVFVIETLSGNMICESIKRYEERFKHE